MEDNVAVNRRHEEKATTSKIANTASPSQEPLNPGNQPSEPCCYAFGDPSFEALNPKLSQTFYPKPQFKTVNPWVSGTEKPFTQRLQYPATKEYTLNYNWILLGF